MASFTAYYIENEKDHPDCDQTREPYPTNDYFQWHLDPAISCLDPAALANHLEEWRTKYVEYVRRLRTVRFEVRAAGAELAEILYQFPRVQRLQYSQLPHAWFGDEAWFIIANIHINKTGYKHD